MTDETSITPTRFALPSRILHWLMAPMVIAQLFIGVTMIASLSYYPLLLAIHRPLGILILIFAVIRLANRLTHKLPPFLATMNRAERRIASWSEYLLYALLLVQPLAGLGHAVGREIPDHHGGAFPSARHRTAQHRCLCGAAGVPQRFRVPAFPDVHRPHVCGSLSHARAARSAHRSDGSVAHQTRVPATGRSPGLITVASADASRSSPQPARAMQRLLRGDGYSAYWSGGSGNRCPRSDWCVCRLDPSNIDRIHRGIRDQCLCHGTVMVVKLMSALAIRPSIVTRTLTLCGHETTKRGVVVPSERIVSQLSSIRQSRRARVEADSTRRLVRLLEQVDGLLTRLSDAEIPGRAGYPPSRPSIGQARETLCTIGRFAKSICGNCKRIWRCLGFRRWAAAKHMFRPPLRRFARRSSPWWPERGSHLHLRRCPLNRDQRSCDNTRWSCWAPSRRIA